MKAIIIDDETRVRNTITKLVESNFPDVSIVASAGDIESGYKMVTELNPDILFLDIHLPDGNGFDLLKKIETISFKLIFVTAHEEYALQAIKLSALDYILKPIDQDELSNAINKAHEIFKREEEQLKVKALLDNFEEKKTLKRIILRTSDYLHFVNIDDIIRCESDNNYTFFYLTDNKKVLVSKTIKEYEELLKNSGFLRVHQSHLINLLFVDKYVKSEGGYLQMKDNSNIPISINNKQYVLKMLNAFLY